MKNWALRQLLIWGGLALLASVILPHVLPRPAPVRSNPALALAPAPAPVAAQPQNWAPGAQVFPADAQGHVYIDALVNGAPVHFLVDTGATLVSLTMHDAQAAGIDPGALKFTVQTATANGATNGAPVTLHDVRIGQAPIYDVPALVHQNLPVSLLGQSFLTRLRSYDMQNGQLTLDWN
ncbi:MAG TPA: TIGR02281 family clan AA aspartic protease [Stellaceae bacterium]|nr:TIGR02281 family clan AA aspartic protease [Stellaceae bacterium]